MEKELPYKGEIILGRRRTLYTRLFVSFTLISVCCILVLATVIFYLYRNISIANVNKANQNVLLNTETVFTNYKEIVQNYTMDFYANPNINSLMMSGDTEWSDQLYNALSQVRGALVVNQYLENAYIFGVDKPVAMFENMPLSAESKQELFELVKGSQLVDSPFLWKAVLNDGTPMTLMIVFYNDMAFAHSEYYGGVALTVNLGKLQKNLFSQKTEESTRYAVLDEQGDVLMHSTLSSTPLNAEMLNRVVASPSERGSFVYKGTEEPQLITFIYSPRDKLWFLSETSYKDSVRDISRLRNILVLLCLFLIAAVSVSANLVSRRIYQPIRRLFGNIFHISGNQEALRFGNDLDAADLELEMIGAKLKQLKKESDDSALMRWLLSPHSDANHAETPMMNICASGGAYCVCVLAAAQPNPDESPAATVEEIIAGIETAFSGRGSIQSFRPHQGGAVIILSEATAGSLGDYALYREKWEKIAAWLSEAGASHALGISGLTSDVGLLRPKYSEAADCLQYIKFHQQQNIIFGDDIIHLNSSPMPDNTLEPVLQAVRHPDQTDRIPQAVERLLAVACSYRAESATTALSRLAFELSRTAVAGVDAWHAEFWDYYRQVWQIQSYDKLKSWLEECCFAALERLANITAVRTRSLAAEAVHYIREQYYDPGISLNVLADKLSISPAYLSKLIAEEVGSSFPDFINQLRLEQAKLLLVTNLELDIREIAARVGYGSSTYFTTQFKKRYGVTPSKWRMNHILQSK